MITASVLDILGQLITDFELLKSLKTVTFLRTRIIFLTTTILAIFVFVFGDIYYSTPLPNKHRQKNVLVVLGMYVYVYVYASYLDLCRHSTLYTS
jgi:hypothetical protein